MCWCGHHAATEFSCDCRESDFGFSAMATPALTDFMSSRVFIERTSGGSTVVVGAAREYSKASAAYFVNFLSRV